VDVYTADPTSVLDYSKDWKSFLKDGETLVSSTWTIPEGIEEPPGKPQSITGDITTVWLTGGTNETLYVVTNHVVTSDGREQDDSFSLYITDL
jgi:hypothetical protein